jgi:predicted alpha/beta superfamily hydrolase
MKKILIAICVFYSVTIVAQQTFNHTINSPELGGERTLKIYLPASYESNSERDYPLTIVFDADYLFDVYVGNSVLFAQKEKAPEQIIVGIVQSGDQRYEDCSYDRETSRPTQESTNFFNFVKNDLLVYMEDNYRISPFKTIVGNTITANFTNYFFIDDNHMVNAYININPYYAPEIPAAINGVAASVKNNTYYYYLGSGDYLSQKRQDGIARANSELASIENEKFNYKYEDLSGATTVSSIGQSISSAIAFIFDIYSSISKEEYNTKIKDLSPPDAIAYLENKYVDIEYLFGSNLKMREKDIYAIEGIIIDKENGEYLRDFGEMIFKLYPESPLGNYYIGLGFELNGKFKRALEAYKEGYMKIEGSPKDADLFYKNVERVAAKVK